jgi:hypothetical protein
VTIVSLANPQNRLHEEYVTQHADCGDEKTAALVYQRDIRPLLPSPAALAPGGIFLVARVPNAVSPLGGHIRGGDFTHQTSFTAPSTRHLARAAGFASVGSRSSPPVAHGLAGAAQVTVWQGVSACYRIALADKAGTLRPHGHPELDVRGRKDVELVSSADRDPA